MNKTIYILAISLLLVGCASDKVGLQKRTTADHVTSAPFRAFTGAAFVAMSVPVAIVGSAFGMKSSIAGFKRVWEEGWCGEKNEYCDTENVLSDDFPAEQKKLVKQILVEYGQLDRAQDPAFRSHRVDEQQLFSLQRGYFPLIKKVLKNDYAIVYNSLNYTNKKALFKVMTAGKKGSYSQHRTDAQEVENNDNSERLISAETAKTISDDMGVIGALLLPPHADGVWQHFLNKGDHINEDEILAANGYNHSAISAITKNESETGWQYIALRLKYLKDRGAIFSNASSSYGW